jgi:hypothetical protein
MIADLITRPEQRLMGVGASAPQTPVLINHPW